MLLHHIAALVWKMVVVVVGGTCQIVFVEDPIIFYVILLSKP